MKRIYVLLNEKGIVYSVQQRPDIKSNPCGDEIDVTDFKCKGLLIGKKWTGSEFIDVEPEPEPETI